MKHTTTKTLLILTAMVGAASLQADDAVFQASLTPDIAIYPRGTDIHGLSLNIWGENPQQGLTLGLVNGSTGESSGFTWGLVNYADSYRGVSWALVNVSRGDYIGWQSGWVNVSLGNFTGFQSGRIVNYAQECTGFQLGLVNYSQSLRGVQVGLVNVAVNNPWFTEFPNKLATGFPIVNWSF
ncbi:MAG TPA: hypothetical protein VG347_25320 [Verrucomicrobiae bacterium]|nr:hypothetical protein [Verrucomicrobiae bacterium]